MKRKLIATLLGAALLVLVPAGTASADAQIVCLDENDDLAAVVSANDNAYAGFVTAAAAVTPSHQKNWGITCSAQIVP